jgi:cation-transporting ATPase E
MPDLKVLAVISIRDEIRPDCKEIISKFIDNGMDIKVISGDDPETVEAIFKLAEIPGERKIISGDKLDAMNEEEFAQAALETNIFGRMRPEQKERIIDSLRKSGRYVAMVGDGINDVRSIKKAQVGVAVQSGSGAARGVADMVLMNDDFKAMPQAIIEGKRTVSGMRDILRLYITRNFVLAALVLVLLLIFTKCPLRPIQNTVYALLTVSIAAFLMTLWAKPTENKDLILPGVMRFVLPTTLTITVFALAIYALFYFGTLNHWMDGAFELSSSYQMICDRLNMTMDQLFNKLSIEGTPDNLTLLPTLERTAEINARNAMLLFLLISGILELIILFPLTKRLSITDDYQRDVKPTILALLLLGLTYAFYQIPEVYVTVAETLPVGNMWGFIAGAVAVWYVITLFVLKSPRLQPLSNFFDRMVRRGLQKSFEKQSRKELQEEDD